MNDANKIKLLSSLRKNIQQNNVEKIRHLLQFGVHDPVLDYEALNLAFKFGNIDIIDAMVQYGYNIHIENNKHLIDSIKSNQLDLTSYILTQNPNLSINNHEALTTAFLYRRLPIMKMLIEHGENPRFIITDLSEYNKHYTFSFVMRKDSLPIFTYLSTVLDLSNFFPDLLYYAASTDKIDLVSFFLDIGYNPKICNLYQVNSNVKEHIHEFIVRHMNAKELSEKLEQSLPQDNHCSRKIKI